MSILETTRYGASAKILGRPRAPRFSAQGANFDSSAPMARGASLGKSLLNHDFPNRNDSFSCHVFADDLSNTFSFLVTRHKSLLVQILKILKLKFENFKTSFKPWFPESKWFFWMSCFRWWPIKYIFISRYAAQVFACSNFKDFEIEIWKF